MMFEISDGPIWNMGLNLSVFLSKSQIAPASLSSVFTMIFKLFESASSNLSVSSSASIICHVARKNLLSSDMGGLLIILYVEFRYVLFGARVVFILS